MKPSTPWIMALLASVLMNGVLAGFVLHRTADGPDWTPDQRHGESRRPPGPRGSGLGMDLRDLVFAMPEEAREEARQRARDNIAEFRPLFEQARTAREDFEAAMRAETFDREAAADALRRLRSLRDALELSVEDDVLDLVAGLDVQTRTEILEATGRDERRRHVRNGPGEPRGDGPPPPDGPRPD